jgi:cytochrome P450
MKLWSPWDAAHFNDPYEMYARLRTEDPVHRSQTGEWIITRYEHVRDVLKDNRFITGNRLEWIKRGIAHLHNHELDFHAIAQAMCGFMLFLNPPQHTRMQFGLNGRLSRKFG